LADICRLYGQSGKPRAEPSTRDAPAWQMRPAAINACLRPADPIRSDPIRRHRMRSEPMQIAAGLMDAQLLLWIH
jgi:hypothetical protein